MHCSCITAIQDRLRGALPRALHGAEGPIWMFIYSPPLQSTMCPGSLGQFPAINVFFFFFLRGRRGRMEWLVRLYTFPRNTWEQQRLQIFPGRGFCKNRESHAVPCRRYLLPQEMQLEPAPYTSLTGLRLICPSVFCVPAGWPL